MGGKYLVILVILMMGISGCSLFVAQQPIEDNKVCVSKTKLNALLQDMNMSLDDLKDELSRPAEIEEVPEEPAEAPEEAEEVPEEPTEAPEEAEEVPEEPAEVPEEAEEVPEEPEEKPAEPADVPIMRFNEGDLVKLSPKASDKEGDKVTFTYSAPLNDEGEWQTKAGDAGEYLVSVTASDGKASTTKQVKIIIESANSAPVISNLADIEVEEGDTVSFEPVVTDPDGDDVTISYSGWMDSSSYTTNFNDAGTYSVTVTATDGVNTASKTVTVIVKDKNRKPVLDELDSITVKEGETVAVDARASDPDGDDVVITYSSPLDDHGTWKTKEGDAGTYLVTITASDGKAEDSETITIVVQSTNQPPELQVDDVDVVVQKGETATVILSPVAVDPDGDDVEVSYRGFMRSNTKVVSEDDEGEHSVIVTASDGKAETTKTVTVTVEVNTPPEFTFG